MFALCTGLTIGIIGALLILFSRSKCAKRHNIISIAEKCIGIIEYLPGEDKRLSTIKSIYKLLNSLKSFSTKCELEMFIRDLDFTMKTGEYNTFMDTNYIDLHYDLHQPLIKLRGIVFQYKEIM